MRREDVNLYFANVRKLVKDNKTKQIVVAFTPEIFIIKMWSFWISRNKFIIGLVPCWREN